MDSRSVAFLEVMAAISVLGLVAFLIFLVARQPAGANAASVRGRPTRAHWVEMLLALLAVLISAVLVLWQIGVWTGSAAEGNAADGSSRGLLFFAVMMIIGAAALVLFLIALFWRSARQSNDLVGDAQGDSVATVPAAAPQESARASHESPSAARLFGLLAFGLVYLLVNWSSVSYEEQYRMMLHLVYPAGFIVALVMLFDKASRAWDVKPPGETLREWLYCDALLALYLFGYLGLLSVSAMDGAGEAYRGMFWDFLHVLGLLLMFWFLDRKIWRVRFLLANAWLIVLPLMLLVWRDAHQVVMVEPVSWWGTIWPFFFLAVVFFVLEVIVLIANRDNASQGMGIAKDLVFLILYVIFMIVGRPAGS